MKQVDLKPFIPDNRNGKFNSDLFQGTIIESMGLGKYCVNIMFLGVAPKSRVVGTNEEALKLEAEIWRAMSDE